MLVVRQQMFTPWSLAFAFASPLLFSFFSSDFNLSPLLFPSLFLLDMLSLGE